MEDEGLQEDRRKDALPDLRQVKLNKFLPSLACRRSLYLYRVAGL
jgi:hypothetical protein